MISSEKSTWSTPLLITVLIFFVLATLYFTSSYLSNQQASLTRRDLRYSSTPSQAIKTLDRVVLTRDQKFVIGRNCLVYKGIEKNKRCNTC